ncbi:NUDIX domain-containing protein [Acetobacteraceae bacterium]|nr:NUDIX domain-containing protein [Candidatus Parcubacteria bacterium]
MAGEPEKFLGNVAQKALIKKDGKILVCRGIGDKVWEFPGGRLHVGETPVEGIVREIKEELGIKITNIKPFYVGSSFHYKSNMEQVFITYTCDYNSASLAVDPKEIEEIKWVTLEEIKILPMFEDGGTKGTVAELVKELMK